MDSTSVESDSIDMGQLERTCLMFEGIEDG